MRATITVQNKPITVVTATPIRKSGQVQERLKLKFLVTEFQALNRSLYWSVKRMYLKLKKLFPYYCINFFSTCTIKYISTIYFTKKSCLWFVSINIIMVSFYKANISYIKAIFRRFTNSNIIRNSIPKMKYYISKTVGSIILEKYVRSNIW